MLRSVSLVRCFASSVSGHRVVVTGTQRFMDAVQNHVTRFGDVHQFPIDGAADLDADLLSRELRAADSVVVGLKHDFTPNPLSARIEELVASQNRPARLFMQSTHPKQHTNIPNARLVHTPFLLDYLTYDPTVHHIRAGILSLPFAKDAVRHFSTNDVLAEAIATSIAADDANADVYVPSARLTCNELASWIGAETEAAMEFVDMPIEVIRQDSDISADAFQYWEDEQHVREATLSHMLNPQVLRDWVKVNGSVFRPEKTAEAVQEKSTSAAMRFPALKDKFCAINYIAVEPHYSGRFEELFQTRAHAVDTLKGFRGMQVLRPMSTTPGSTLEKGAKDSYLVVSWWDSEDDFVQWRRDPAFLKGHRGFGDLKEARKKKERPPMDAHFITYTVFAE